MIKLKPDKERNVGKINTHDVITLKGDYSSDCYFILSQDEPT